MIPASHRVADSAYVRYVWKTEASQRPGSHEHPACRSQKALAFARAHRAENIRPMARARQWHAALSKAGRRGEG
eukprot:6175031-Pleurochrysis_carterae.AAC.1